MARLARRAGAGGLRLLLLQQAQRVEGDGRVGEGAAGTHLGGDPDRLHDLLRRRARPGRRLGVALDAIGALRGVRSEEHTSELQSLMRISYAVFCLNTKRRLSETRNTTPQHHIP